jgi:hypothetical protein
LRQYYMSAVPPATAGAKTPGGPLSRSASAASETGAPAAGDAQKNANANAHLASSLLLVPQDEVSGTFLSRVINAGDADLLKFVLDRHSRARCCGVKNQDDPSGLPQVHPGDLTSGGQYKYEKGQFLKWRGSNKPYWKWIEKGAEER